MTFVQSVRKVLRREVLAICVVIFLADVMSGIVSPTFSLYAQALGASLTVVGALSSTVSLTRLFSSMPAGVMSDRLGRKTVLTAGMLLSSLAAALYAWAPNAYWLFLGRIVGGLGMVSTFFIGIAYVGDVVGPEERGLAYGLYATAMGTGFTVGPLIGAAVAERHGIAASYRVAAALTLLGGIIAARGLTRANGSAGSGRQRGSMLPWAGTGEMLRNPRLLAGSLGNLLMSMSFGGAVSNFFPVLLSDLQVTQAAINSMFSVRAFGSTLARLPTGAITARLPSRTMMYASLALAMLAQVMMTQTTSARLLSLILLAEGVAFGTFLTSGQVFVAENCTPQTRGTAVGAYSTAGGLGGTLSAFLLGAIADRWGVQAVFQITGILIFIGLVIMSHLNRQPTRAPLAAECQAAEGAPSEAQG